MSDFEAGPPERELDAATATTSSSVLRGGTWYVLTSALPQVYTFVLSVAAARFLGPALFGRQSFIAFVSLSVAMLLSSSMYITVLRHVGESAGAGHPGRIRSLLIWAWRVEAVAAVAAAGFLGILAAAGAEPQTAWLLAGAIAGVTILQSVPTAILIGLQKFKQAGLVSLATGFFATVATVLVLWAGAGITGMFAVETVAAGANLAWTSWIALRTLNRIAPTSEDAGELKRKAARYAMVTALGVFLDYIVATRSEYFFLNRFSTKEEIGFYSIAFASVAGLKLVPSALGGTVAPAFATLFGAGQMDRVRSGYVRAARLLVALTLPLTAAAFVLGPELVQVVFGDEFAPVKAPLRILLVVFPLVALSSLANALLSGLGRVRAPLGACAAAAVVDVGLALVLVPLIDAKGAAAANSSAQAVYALYVLVVSARILGRMPWHWWILARSLAVAAVAGAVAWLPVWFIGGLVGVILGSVGFVVVFVALAATVHVMPAEDAEWLETTIGGRFGARVGRIVRRAAV